MIVYLTLLQVDDEERAPVLGVLLEGILAYTRSLPGSRRLRALVVFDEVHGLLPPHPATPPTQKAVGFCVVGRLQTDADRARVVESLANANETVGSPRESAAEGDAGRAWGDAFGSQSARFAAND